MPFINSSIGMSAGEGVGVNGRGLAVGVAAGVTVNSVMGSGRGDAFPQAFKSRLLTMIA